MLPAGFSQPRAEASMAVTSSESHGREQRPRAASGDGEELSTPRMTPRASPRGMRPAGAAAPAAEGTVRVCVAARVRPLLPLEAAGPGGAAASNCIEASGHAVAIGKSCFLFDHVFGPEATQEEVYREYVEPLVDATYEGVNGTLLAYGQTGSGKTYTMGTSGLPHVAEGALQRAIRAIFARARERTSTSEGRTIIRVSYAEIFTDASRGGPGACAEEVRDLLEPSSGRHALATVRADVEGQVRLEGVVEHEVATEQEAMGLLALGSAARATCSTRMHDASSRSHALFSLDVVQRRLLGGAPSTLTARFQFVDLAGSEKVKLSGVEGEQLSQAININHGLFVLGKVITALTDGHQHVPFRESKLTRILQNSLGGNSRTCMIACVSPSSGSVAETISTLTYAAKAKEIRNKPVVNRGSSCPSCAALQARVHALEGRGGVEAAARVAGRHTQHMAEIEAENLRLRRENERLVRESEARRQAEEAPASAEGFGSPEEAAEERRAVRAFEARAVHAELLFSRCSERLAALQEVVRAAELPVDEEALLEPAAEEAVDEFSFEVHGLGEASPIASTRRSGDSGGSPEDEIGIPDLDEDPDLARLELEARRKRRLLLQVEENQHAMATLEARSQERMRQHEAARDIAERELARLQAELEAARSREEQLTSFQERYDQRLAALSERNAALEREKREAQRLRALQRQQETRLRVLQDSVRQVTGERDNLRGQLAEEHRRRREEEAKGKRERSAARQKILSLSARVASLERCSAASGSDTGGSCTPTRLSFSPGAVRRTRGGRGRSSLGLPHSVQEASSAEEADGCEDGAGGPWEAVLRDAAERVLRERQLANANKDLEILEDQALDMTARRERLSVTAEAEGRRAGGKACEALATVEQELTTLSAAREYQRERVWMLRRELEACSPRRELPQAALVVAQGLGVGELASGAAWLCSEATRWRDEATQVREALAALGAQVAQGQAALLEARHHASEREQALDVARGDYESRVTYLIRILNEEGRVDLKDLQDVVGEEAVSLLTKRVAYLEDCLAQERREGQERGQRKVEQDVELITSCRKQESENRLLRSQVKEATAKSERTMARAARREAQLLERIAALELRPAASELPAPTSATSSSAPPVASGAMPFAVEFLEDFWRSTGLNESRQELLEAIRGDVEALCKERLQQHLEWKRELEARVEELRKRQAALLELLGDEERDRPPEGANLLQNARHLEATVAALDSLREGRQAELGDLLMRVEDLHQRLHEASPEASSQVSGAPGALRPEALAEVRERLAALEALERQRQAEVAISAAELRELWGELGLRVPEDLEPQEAALLQGPPPVSDTCVAYIASRRAALTAWQAELGPEEQIQREAFEAWLQRLAPFALSSLPEAPPQSMPLLPRLAAFRSALHSAEVAAKEFVQQSRSALRAFHESSRLQSAALATKRLEAAGGISEELAVLAQCWEQLSVQRAEHRRISELIASRESLEVEMREFDAESSDPSRFKKRGYSGVQENRRRAEYQRQLRLLDASIQTSTTEWAQREGATYCLAGTEYRGSEILPTEHTHMYAWTGKQLAQKQALQGVQPSGLAFEPPERALAAGTPRSSQLAPTLPIGRASPRGAAVAAAKTAALRFESDRRRPGPAGAGASPRTSPRATPLQSPRGNAAGGPAQCPPTKRASPGPVSSSATRRWSS